MGNEIEPLVYFKKLRSGTGDCKNQRILGSERPYSSGARRGVSDLIEPWDFTQELFGDIMIRANLWALERSLDSQTPIKDPSREAGEGR
ncbi:hypothetical protein V6N11_008654 [Hibiscus sabdariffa]|uniref:Uncharacterized protein n=1 Tax=Hibiscus sabdariffa TaxID=183260 RepID=A0ABR2PPD0_9ROSI